MMKSTIHVGLRCCLLAAFALSTACGSTPKGTGTSGTGGATSGTSGASTTGGTTGNQCVRLAGQCSATASCCPGSICNPQSSQCVVSQGGTTTGGATGTTGGACTPGPLGTPCISKLDCASTLECNVTSDGGSVCGTPILAGTQCVKDGAAPAGTEPCCGQLNTINGIKSCGPLSPCATQGGACGSASGTCCNLLACGDAGTCVPSCGGQLAACATSADCCEGDGYSCQSAAALGIAGVTGNVCLQFPLPAQTQGQAANQFVGCTNQQVCAALAPPPQLIECQLGAGCAMQADAGANSDPCAAVGLVCDMTANVCRAPGQLETCVQGGPSCYAVADTTTPLICSPPDFTNSNSSGSISLCAQPCLSGTAGANGTQDCAQPDFSCLAQVNVCFQNSGCKTPYGKCSSQGINDGVCVPINNGGSPFTLCFQANTTPDAGGPGMACNPNANRQQGGFCDTSDFCNAGLCGAICDADKAGGTPACAQGQICFPTFAETGTQTFGTCATSCDFTMLSGGPCTTTAAGVPSKCIPAALLGQPDGTPSVCGAANANPLPIGANCTGATLALGVTDPCVAGAICLGPTNGPSICTQVCNPSGTNTCPNAGACTGIQFSGQPAASTSLGSCPVPSSTGSATTGSSTSGGSTGSSSTGGSTTGGACVANSAACTATGPACCSTTSVCDPLAHVCTPVVGGTGGSTTSGSTTGG